MKKPILILAAGLALLTIAAGAFISLSLSAPYKGFSDPVFIEVKRGTSTSAMADELARTGVVKAPWLFMAARAINRGKVLQAGEYRFEKPASPLEVFSRIQRGDIYFMEVLIPEGFNIFDIAAALDRQGTISSADFLAAAKDPALVRDLDPKAESLEGYLFPNKYRIYRHTTARQLCRQMVTEFRAQWAKAGSGQDIHRILTLASLVEREARLPQEQASVASVFANRLRLGMKLDCDPTTVYAALLENRYRGVIHQSDLANDHPYNTYRHPGLPPGPIANPGLGAIRAAIHPADTGYLYFVAKADGTGGHNFSESLQKHTAAVAQYHRATAKH